jgi:hypothetical protein
VENREVGADGHAHPAMLDGPERGDGRAGAARGRRPNGPTARLAAPRGSDSRVKRDAAGDSARDTADTAHAASFQCDDGAARALTPPAEAAGCCCLLIGERRPQSMPLHRVVVLPMRPEPSLQLLNEMDTRFRNIARRTRSLLKWPPAPFRSRSRRRQKSYR